MRRFIVLAAIMSSALVAVVQAASTVASVTHSEFQAVNAAGEMDELLEELL